MALQTARSLPQLELECENLNLKVTPAGKKLQKDDYIKALREFYIQSYGGYSSIPKSLNLMLRLESPMLAAQYKSCKETQQHDMWETNKYYAEEKEDGVRILNFFLGEEKYNAYSRNNSTKDFLPISYKENICLDDVDFSKITDTFILDSECICINPRISTILGRKGVITETQLQAVTALLSMNPIDSIRIQREEKCPLLFKTFDCIYYNGEWLIDRPLIERRSYLKKALQQLQLAGFRAQLPKSNISNKKAFYQAIIKEGGEGCFYSQTKVTMFDGSLKNISDIEVGDKVLSYNIEENKVEIKEVINVFNNGFKPKEDWIYLSHNRNIYSKENMWYKNFNILCTKKHKYYDGNSYKEINKLDSVYEYRPNFTKDMIQIFLGIVSSDGCITNCGFSFSQKHNSEYYEYLKSVYQDYISGEGTRVSCKGSLIDYFHIRKIYFLDFFSKYCIDTSSYKLNTSKENINWCRVFEDFDYISLAHFIMCDGTISKKGQIEIGVYSYSDKEVNSFINMLIRLGVSREGISKKYDKRVSKSNNQSGISLRIHKKESLKLAYKIAPYFVEGEFYKINRILDVSKVNLYNIDTKYNLVKVNINKKDAEEVSKFNKRKGFIAYDIEVEDNHNYFVGGCVLVHNCILKRIDSPYTPTSSRAHRDWVKVKRSFSESLEMQGLADTIDGFITGFEPGSKDKANANLVGTLIISTYLRDDEGNITTHEIAHVSSISDDLRKEITTYDEEGNPILKQDYYNKVVEVDGQCISARAKRLRHAVLVRFRPDRSSDTCILDESSLRALIL